MINNEMKKPNKELRRKIYQKFAVGFESKSNDPDGAFYFGICRALIIIYPTVDIDDLPELSPFYQGGYWWDILEEGNNERIIALCFAIAMLDNPL